MKGKTFVRGNAKKLGLDVRGEYKTPGAIYQEEKESRLEIQKELEAAKQDYETQKDAIKNSNLTSSDDKSALRSAKLNYKADTIKIKMDKDFPLSEKATERRDLCLAMLVPGGDCKIGNDGSIITHTYDDGNKGTTRFYWDGDTEYKKTN